MPVERLHDKVILKHPKGSSVEILFYGATVISWKSGTSRNPEPIERLFVSSKAALDGSKPVRGGIPVVFPCFGAPTHPEHTMLTQHGFARSETWSWNEVVMDNEAGVSLSLTLQPNEKIRSIYKPPFHLNYVVTLAEHQLSTDIHVTNTSQSSASAPDILEYQALFHTYIRAPASQVLVAPLQNLSYYDKTESTAEGKATPKVERRAKVDVKKFTDSVYEDASQHYEVTWNKGGISVRSNNLKDVVVWNPQDEGRKMSDMEEGGWEKYVCVEPGYVRGPVLWTTLFSLVFPLSGSLAPAQREERRKLTARHVDRYISKLTKSLNHAVALSLKRDPLSSKSQFVRAILLVKGVHFYGFHSSYSPFLKVYLADPGYIHRTVAILQSGTVMGTRFLVFESHLSFVLQFMCDFGLYGCGWIEVENVLQRDVQSTIEGDYSRLESSGPIFPPSTYLRQTRMPLEVDVIAPNILNRQNITARNLHHKLQKTSPHVSAEPLVLSVRELWEDERKRRIVRGLEPTPTVPVDPSDSLRGPGCDWSAEAEYWERIREKIEADRELQRSLPPSSNGWDNWAMTTFESIEALWEEPWRIWKPQIYQPQGSSEIATDNEASPETTPFQWDAPDEDQADFEVVDVDISKLSSQEVTQIMDNEESEWVQPEDGDEDEDEDDEAGVCAEDQDELHQENYTDDDASDLSTLSDPFDVPEKSPNQLPSMKVQLNLSSPLERPGASHIDYPTTPTRGGQTASSLWLHEDITSDTKMQTSCIRSDMIIDDGLTKRSSSQPSSTFPEGPIADASFQPNAWRDEAMPPHDHHSSSTPFSSGVGKEGTSYAPIKLFNEFYSVHAVAFSTNYYEYALTPPSASSLVGTLDEHGVQAKIYRPPHYSSSPDIPERPREYAGLSFHLKGGQGITHLDAWSESSDGDDVSQLSCQGIGGWEYSSLPPHVKDIRRWLAKNQCISGTRHLKMKSQIEGTTQKNIYGLRETLETKAPAALIPRGRQSMGILALETYGESISRFYDEI
ncbi:hypothetical protein C0991_000171 [Blastosporella zonata]|nr:hypothetical protein C0991_000171 [Blastosporella zonata]